MSLSPARRPREYSRRTRPTPPSVIGGRRGLRWVILIRQSKKRHDRDGQVVTVSREVQERACRDAILVVDSAPERIDVITEIGRPGGPNQKRPGRDRMLRLVERGEANAVMAYKAARIGRDIEESEHIWNRCVGAGAFISATDCLDLSNDVYRGIHWAMAQANNRDRSDYSTAVVERRRTLGAPPIKTAAPYGMRWADDLPAIVDSEWPTVEEIYRRFDDGETMGSIARLLTARAVPRQKGGTQWDRASVSRILYCSWYVGLVPDRDDYWDAGIQYLDAMLWQRVQRRLTGATETGLRKAHSLSGLLFCGICESPRPMTLCYSRKTRKDGTVLQRDRYRCALHEIDPKLCPGQSIDSARTEEVLLANLAHLLTSDDLARSRFARRALVKGDAIDKRLARIAQRAQRLQREQDQLWQRRQAGEVIPDRIYNREMQAREEQLATLHREDQRLSAQRTLSSEQLSVLRDELMGGGALSADWWFSKPAARRNEFLKTAFPYGIFIRPTTPEMKRGVVTGRLALRHAEDHADVQSAEGVERIEPNLGQ